MGDIADMMLDGEICEGCGDFLGGSIGYPRRCASCSGEDDNEDTQAAPPAKKVSCPKCKRRVKEIGLPQHMKDKHGQPN